MHSVPAAYTATVWWPNNDEAPEIQTLWRLGVTSEEEASSQKIPLLATSDGVQFSRVAFYPAANGVELVWRYVAPA